ncbi:MAG: class I SAM-dependent methyltransferase [Christensenellaceae bacterium]|jgi:ubiquinone/menaquinone biosynthesis C-methylase UbiE
MIKGLAKNFKKPRGFFGTVVLNRMNKGHEPLTKWALDFVSIGSETIILDVGCGGGNAVFLMSQQSKQVYGVDYAKASVRKSRQKNAAAIAAGNVEIRQASVSSLPFEENTFDLVTAFETIYFWPDLPKDFLEIKRVLKPGGQFMAVFQNSPDETKRRSLERTIDGMKIPFANEVGETLKKAGFAQYTVYENPRLEMTDICVVGEK